MSLWRLWLLWTSSMMCNNTHASSIRFFRNWCKYSARRSSFPDILSYATWATILLPFLLSKLNMSHSVPPFYQNAYLLYLSTWMAANRIIPACGIIIAIDSFWCSIFARSFRLSIWFDYFVANSYHDLNSSTSLRRTLRMVAYPPYLWMLSIGMTLAVGGRATRWRLCDAASSTLTRNVHQAIDLVRLRLFVNSFRRVANKYAVMMISVNAAFPGRCAFPYLVNMFFTFSNAIMHHIV